LQLAPDDSTIPVVAPKRRHMRCTPQLPLATCEFDPEKIIKKGNLSLEGFSYCPKLKISLGKRQLSYLAFDGE
jgi:hypothetical protein